MKTILVLIFTFMLVFLACQSERKQKKANDETSVKKRISTGCVNTVTSGKDPSCRFALYLPADSTEPLPLFIFFDPHGKARDVAEKYKGLADKYSCAIAVSVNIRNGMKPDECEHYFYSMYNEICGIINEDTSHIYLSGLSGGARVAAYLTLKSGIPAGLITCGAGVPEIAGINNNKFYYAGIAGLGDFAFSELYNSANEIKNNAMHSCFIYFEGKHEWPSDSIMEYAFMTMLSEKNKDFSEKISKLIKSHEGRQWKKYLTYNTIIDLLKILPGYEKEKQEINTYLNSKESSGARRDIENILKSENAEISKMKNAAMNFESAWWKKHIGSLQVTDGKPAYSLTDYKNIRMLGYIGIMEYMLVSSALNNNDLKSAYFFLQIYSLAEPQNADVSYYYGVYLTKTGNFKDAIDSLENAVNKGFDDYSRWMSQSDFSRLRDSLRFNELEAKLSTGDQN